MSETDLARAAAFVHERAGEALRLLRERDERDEKSRHATAQSEGPVPREKNPALVHLDAVREVEPELRGLRATLQDYVDRIEPVSPSDEGLITAVDILRRLLEAVYRQPIRFEGEQRPSGDRSVDWTAQLATARADARAAGVDKPELVGDEWVIRNLTAEPIELSGRGQPTFVVPAFGSRRFKRDPEAALDDVDARRARNEIELTHIPPRTVSDDALLIILGLYFWVVPIFVAVTLIWGEGSWWLVGIPVLVALPILVLIFRSPERRKRLADFFRDVLSSGPRRVKDVTSLALVFLFAVAVPGTAIFFGADLHDVVERARTGPVTDGGAADLTMLARTVQFLFIAAASMLPALLYFQFDRERLGTIWEKFTRQVFRLDPHVRTEPALLNKYEFLMEEVFGRRRPDPRPTSTPALQSSPSILADTPSSPTSTGSRARLLPGKRSPIVVATVVIVLGWLLTLLNPQIGTISDQSNLVSLFQPHRSAVTFAFLGAYVFAIGALLRGYVRRDLRPKSYSDITVRIVTVVALAWLLEVFFPDDAPVLLAFAFATGLVPKTAFTLLREVVQSSYAARSDRGGWLRRLLKRGTNAKGEEDDEPDSSRSGSSADLTLPELDDPLPLTDLEGIDYYDRARLASEGITNIEALAHSDLIELLVQTRISAPRLVDWMDQAILYLHIPRHDTVGNNGSSYTTLRRLGIRNATDLIRAHRKAQKRGTENAFVHILDSAGDDGPERLSVILDAIADEEWIANLLYWRYHGDLENPRLAALLDSLAPSDADNNTAEHEAALGVESELAPKLPIARVAERKTKPIAKSKKTEPGA